MTEKISKEIERVCDYVIQSNDKDMQRERLKYFRGRISSKMYDHIYNNILKL